MKKITSFILAVLVCVICIVPAYAVNGSADASDPLPTLEEIQAHFPDLQLGASGYVDDIALMAEVDFSEPSAIYKVEDNGDLYCINIYPDNSYIAYGFDVSTTALSDGYLSKGFKSSGKVYVKGFGAMFDLYYTVTCNREAATISSVTTPVCTWLINYGVDANNNPLPTNASARVIGSTHGTSYAAGSAKLYQYGSYLGTLKLTLYLYSGNRNDVIVSSYY